MDVVGALTDSVNPTDYLKKIRKRDELLAEFLGTNCPQVEMLGENGKRRKVARQARIAVERETRDSVVTNQNAIQLNKVITGLIENALDSIKKE